MNILNCMFLKWNAGTENSFLSYSKTLKNLNYNTINLVHPKAQIINILEQNNLPYIKSKLLGKFGKNDIFTILYFKYLIKKHNIKIVIAHQGRLISLFKIACSKNVKLIGINHGYNPKHNVGVDFAITLNSTTYNNTIKLGQDKKKIIILPHSVNTETNPSQISATPVNDIIHIGSYGRFSPEKGFTNLIESLNLLNKKNVKFKAYIGGTGIDETNLKNLVKKYNLSDHVSFTGWVTDKEKFFKKINLFILPSKQEEFSITILESMKYFTPILSTKCSGPSDIIKDQNTGFLVDIDSPEQMSNKIEFINNNSVLLPQIAANAYSELEKKYSQTSFRNHLDKIIKEISSSNDS